MIFARLLEHPFMRFLGAFFLGFLCFILWINFIVFPLSLYVFFDGGWLHSLGLLVLYAALMLLVRVFVHERILFWTTYGFFVICGGFLGLIFLGSPLDVQLDHKCSFRTVWHHAELYQHSETGDALIYWRKRGSAFYKSKNLPQDQWDGKFTLPDIDGNPKITCFQDYRRLVD